MATAPFDLASAAAGSAVVPIPLSHSPGIHTPSPIPASAMVLPSPMIATASAVANTNSTALVDIQSKPLDLGISDRHRNAIGNHHSLITRTISSTPPSHTSVAAKQPIALNITKTVQIPVAASSISPLSAGVRRTPNDHGEMMTHDLPYRLASTVQSSIAKESPIIKVPIITVTAADTIGASAISVAQQQHHQLHLSNSILRTYEIDDTSNSSCNSKYENNGRFDATDQVTMANGTINNTNSKNVPIAIAPVATATLVNVPPSSSSVSTNKAYKNNGNGSDNQQQQQQRANQTTPTPPPQPPNSVQKNPLRTNSADGLLRSSSTNSSPVPSPNSAQSAPATPVKFPNDYEKSSSPGEFTIRKVFFSSVLLKIVLF